MGFRSGFVAIVGLPNVGKSTLLNSLARQKLAIVSPRPQTTRTRILGIINLPAKKERSAAQVILIDTPGLDRPHTSLGRKMLAEVREALAGSDLVLMIVDARHKAPPSEKRLLDLLKHTSTRTLLLLNKIDLLRGRKPELLSLIDEYQKRHDFLDIIPISALKQDGLELVMSSLVEALPEGQPYFPEEQVTDQPVRFMAAELIREQVLWATQEEVPHSTAVLIDTFGEGSALTRISATIYCEREGQKRILIGSRGEMLKKIGTRARQEIERMLGVKVFLQLFVKVRPGWKASREFVEDLDWRKQLEHLVEAQKPGKPSA